MLRTFASLRRRVVRAGLDRPKQRRIVAMIDAGESYKAISRELGVTAAEIDCTLRRQTAAGFED